MATIAEHYVLCGPKKPFQVDRNFFLPKAENRYVVVDIVLICTSRGETCPDGYYILGVADGENNNNNNVNNQNIGGSFSPSLYLCVKKKLVSNVNNIDETPILDVRVQYQTEAIPPGYKKLDKTVAGYPGKLHSGLGVRGKYIYILKDQNGKILDLEKEQGMKTMKQQPICDIQIVPFSIDQTVSYESNNNNSNNENYINNNNNNSTTTTNTNNEKYDNNNFSNDNKNDDVKKKMTRFLPLGCRLSNRPLRDGKSWGESGQRIELVLKYRGETGNVMDIPYKAEILDRYPSHHDNGDVKKKNSSVESISDLPKQFTEFCYPRGLRLLYSPKGWAGVPGPNFFSWSMTDADLGTRYVTSLVFYEKLFDDKNNNTTNYKNDADALKKTFIDMAKETRLSDKYIIENYETNVCKNLFVPKILNVVSRYCFYQGFQEFLTQLFRVSLSESKIPIEDYVVHFFNCVPVPKFNSLGGLSLTYDGTRKSQTVATFQINSLNEYGVTDFDYEVLFQCLSISNVFHVIALLLLEQKVIFHSKHKCILTPLIQSILALIFPIKWTGIYIPLCSTSLIAVLDAPVPFLIGLDSTEVCNINILADDIYTVDMDNDRILGGIYNEKISDETLPLPIVDLITKRLNRIIEKANIKVVDNNVLNNNNKKDSMTINNTDWSNSAYAFRLAVPPSLSNVDMDMNESIPISETRVRDSFLRFMSLILFAVPKYLKNVKTKPIDDNNHNNNDNSSRSSSLKVNSDNIGWSVQTPIDDRKNLNSYNVINATKKEPEKEDSDDRLEIMEQQNNEQEEEFLELEEMFKLDEYINSASNEMTDFLKRFTQTQIFARYVSQLYHFYNGSMGRQQGINDVINNDTSVHNNNKRLLEQYKFQFFTYTSEYVSINNNNNKSSKKKQKNVSVFRDGDDANIDHVADTLFAKICKKMNVTQNLLQFHNDSRYKNSRIVSSQQVKGPSVDSISRKICLEKKLPSIERPFKYNNKFPLLKQEIINDAYNYYVKCWRSVPMGFVKHVEEMVHIDEDDIDHEIVV